MKYIKFLTSVITVGIILSACDKPAESVKNAEKSNQEKSAEAGIKNVSIETTSPDLAVKSWWKILDLRAHETSKLCKQQVEKDEEPSSAYFRKIAQGAALKDKIETSLCESDAYKREILKVETESETRAVIFTLIKNVTPIPVGAEPDDTDKKLREEGFQFKYLVEKTLEGWKVSQVYRFSEINQKYLDKDPWEKIYDDEDKPLYPSYVLFQ